MTEPAICGAEPWRGDGSICCELPAYHRGIHNAGGMTFRRIKPGTSAASGRSPSPRPKETPWTP